MEMLAKIEIGRLRKINRSGKFSPHKARTFASCFYLQQVNDDCIFPFTVRYARYVSQLVRFDAKFAALEAKQKRREKLTNANRSRELNSLR